MSIYKIQEDMRNTLILYRLYIQNHKSSLLAMYICDDKEKESFMKKHTKGSGVGWNKNNGRLSPCDLMTS